MRKLNNNMPEQGTMDWQRMRLGKYTGSRIADLMGKGRKKDDPFSETAKKYLCEIAAGRMLADKVVNDDEYFALYLEQTEVYNKYMQWGHENEQDARELYEKLTGNKVTEVSSIDHESIEHYAASPDGIVSEANINIEIKCPLPKTFVLYKANIHDAESLKKVMPQYYWQVQAEMDCTGAEAADFIVYCPFMAKPMHIARIERNDDDIEIIHSRIAEAEEWIKKNIINDDTEQTDEDAHQDNGRKDVPLAS